MGTSTKPVPELSDSDPRKAKYLALAEANFAELLEKATSTAGWTREFSEGGVDVDSMKESDSAFYVFRGTRTVDSCTELARTFVVHLPVRRYWDDRFDAGDYILVVERQPGYSLRLAHMRFTTPVWGVSPRDFLCLMGERCLDDGTVVMFAVSVEDDVCPPKKGYVRGTLKATGFVLVPGRDTSGGRLHCRFINVLQVNPNGWIPSSVANIVTRTQPTSVGRIAALIRKHEGFIVAAARELARIHESSFNSRAVLAALQSTCKKMGADKEMFHRPFVYRFTGEHLGKKPELAAKAMEEKGKAESMKMVWDMVRAYAQSTPATFDSLKKEICPE